MSEPQRPDPDCDCLEQPQSDKHFHSDEQDAESEGWKRLLDLVETAAADAREIFDPGREMSSEVWERDVVTLPGTISKLKSVKRFRVGRSSLVRIPPEIGDMDNLESLDTYTSHRLHWYPYEITRCRRLKGSSVSTRALYGNFKYRMTFPALQPQRTSTAGLDLGSMSPGLWGGDSIAACSVCSLPLARSGLHQVWISLEVGTNVLPLLVNACSDDCILKLPQGADSYVKTPHSGGPGLKQPARRY